MPAFRQGRPGGPPRMTVKQTCLLYTSDAADDTPCPDVGHAATSSRRRGLGAWYTPDDVVDGLLDLALEPLLADRRTGGVDAVAAVRVLDPSCGDGAFLVAPGARIHRTLVDMGVGDDRARRTAFGRCVVGIDLDPGAVDSCRRRLAGAGADSPSDRVVEADALLASDDDWATLLALSLIHI